MSPEGGLCHCIFLVKRPPEGGAWAGNADVCKSKAGGGGGSPGSLTVTPVSVWGGQLPP